nr:SH3 domain-containing protein C23A1.17-like [Triticum aestivum]
MVSDDAFDSCPASASSAAAATAASASSAAPPPSTLETDSPFMASTPPAWARQAASDSRPTAPSRSPTPDLSASARSPAPSYGAQIVAPVHYGAAPGPSRDAPPAAGLYGAAPGQSRDAPPAAGLYGAPAQQPYGAPIQQSYDAPGFYGAPVQQPYGGVYPVPYVAQSSTPYALSPVVSSEAPYGAPYAAPGSHVMPPLQPYGHHQHSRAPPSADELTPYSASPTYDSQLPASVSESGPFHFAHLVTVKLSADNYLLWRAQVLPLMLSHYLEGYVDGTLLGPPAMVPSLARSSAIRNQLGKVKKNDLSVTTFFNKVKTLADTLSSIRKPLRDEEFTSFILNGLDEDYDSLVENINGRDTPMPPRDLYARLLNTEQRLAARRSIGVYTEGSRVHSIIYVDPARYMDTGATNHLTSQLDKLATRQPYTGHDQVRTANGSDVWGYAQTSVSGHNYYVSFIDAFSRFTWIYLIKRKSDVFLVLMQFQAHVERLLKQKIIHVQSDWGDSHTTSSHEVSARSVAQ